MTPLAARTMARYNQWMNERVYECCARIPDEERKRDAGAFFNSIHGTLNHLLLGDKIWLGRFLGRPFAVMSLAQELHADVSTVNPEPRRYALWLAATHFFNHQTHHRGQLTTLLAQRGVDPGVTDLIWLPGMQRAQ